jgi:hypothetical protein
VGRALYKFDDSTVIAEQSLEKHLINIYTPNCSRHFRPPQQKLGPSPSHYRDYILGRSYAAALNN